MRSAVRQLLLLAVLVAVGVAAGDRIREHTGPLPDEAADTAGAPGDGEPGDEAPAPAGYTAPDFEQFEEVLDRPLFMEARRPFVAEQPQQVEVRRTLEATLQGVLFSATGRVALLTEAGSSDVIRVAEGEEHDGWRLVEITPQSATFERDGDTVTLQLVYTAGEPVERRGSK